LVFRVGDELGFWEREKKPLKGKKRVARILWAE